MFTIHSKTNELKKYITIKNSKWSKKIFSETLKLSEEMNVYLKKELLFTFNCNIFIKKKQKKLCIF